MSCCGQKRRTLGGMSEGTHEPRELTPIHPPVGSVFFEYFGGTAMTVIGPVTGRSYRFGWPGAQTAVDRKDAASLESKVPHLRKANT